MKKKLVMESFRIEARDGGSWDIKEFCNKEQKVGTKDYCY